jgi:hypothetical protein
MPPANRRGSLRSGNQLLSAAQMRWLMTTNPAV